MVISLCFWDAVCVLQGPDGKAMLVMPRSIFGKRVFYQIYEYPTLLDSCNMHLRGHRKALLNLRRLHCDSWHR